MTIEEQLLSLREPAPPMTQTGILLGTGLVEGFGRYDSPVGTVSIAFNLKGVSSVDLETDYAGKRVEAEPPRAWARRIPEALERGTPGKLPLDLSRVTDFRRTVLFTAAEIPRGEVRPYAWLATRIGNPRASRAVGSAMATNPVPLIVPCHRVVRSDGHLGKYSLGDSHNKRKLLENEGLSVDFVETLASRGVRYVALENGTEFCLPTCPNPRDRHRFIEFHTTDEALDAGYQPCEGCLPLG